MEERSDKQARDLTDFFLEWRDACAIDKCRRAEDVAYVHAMFDAKLKLLTQVPRRSTLGSGVVSLSDISIDFEKTHAFHLVELYFYGQDTIKGRPFKDHLFESSATKNGVGRLNGYFLQTLRSIANDSFRKSAAQASSCVKDEAGKELDPFDFISADTQPTNAEGVSSYDPAQAAERSECYEDFRQRLGKMWNAMDKTERLALLCDVFFLSRSADEIVAASGLKQSAFYNRHPLGKVRGIAEGMLADGYDLDELMNVFRNCIARFAYDFGKGDPDCLPAIAQIEREGLVGGDVN